MRIAAALVVVVGCGGSPKPAPAAPAAPPAAASVAAPEPLRDEQQQPPPEDPKSPQVAVATKQQTTPRNSGDPCEGGEATDMAAGEGGGGEGWKAIDESVARGKASKIGHGSGTCCSGGLGTPKPPDTVTLGVPTAKGDLDRAIIRRYVRRNLNKLRHCYEKTLLAKPGIHGQLVVKFTINDQGLTEDVLTTMAFDPDVGSCAVSVFKTIEFPKPKSANVAVSYPFTFALPTK